MIDREVRRVVYEMTMGGGTPPLSRDVAHVLGVPQSDVLESFRRLADGHILVLQRDSPEILMAAPYSAVPTPFVVHASGTRSYGNCMWDALGIAAMVNTDAHIHTSCADCGTAAEVRIEGGEVRGEGLVHFALPVREWWNDVVFT
jgi:hypothetical protein